MADSPGGNGQDQHLVGGGRKPFGDGTHSFHGELYQQVVVDKTVDNATAHNLPRRRLQDAGAKPYQPTFYFEIYSFKRNIANPIAKMFYSHYHSYTGL